MAKSNRIPLPVKPQTLTVQEAAEAFLERDYSTNTRRNFECDLRRFCKKFGTRGVETMVRDEVAAYLNGLKGRTGHQDIDRIIKRRRDNFSYLLSRMSGLSGVRPVYDRLDKAVCPLGFPIIAVKRDALRSHLIRERIYPPIHWELPAEVSVESHLEAAKLSRSTMTLPVDQRYTVTDMARISDAVETFLRSAS